MTAEVRSIRTPFSAPPASTAGATDLTLPCPHLDLFFTTFLPKWPGPGATALEYSRFLEQFIAAKHCIVERRSEEHTSELKSLMRISYAVFCLKKKKHTHEQTDSK